MSETLQLDFFLASKPALQADGTFVVRKLRPTVILDQGDPVQVITPKQFAEAVGYRAHTILGHYRGSDWLPEHFFLARGKRKLWIKTDAVAHFLDHSQKTRS